MMILNRMPGLILLSVKVVHAPRPLEDLATGPWQFGKKMLQFPIKRNYYK